MWKVLDGEIGDDFLNSFDGSGLVALSWYDAERVILYSSTKPITKLEDMRGMTIRVQESELMVGMMEALGPPRCPWPTTRSIPPFRPGFIDGAENNWPSYESTAHYTRLPILYDRRTQPCSELQLISQATWEKLTKEDRYHTRMRPGNLLRYERELWEERNRVLRKGAGGRLPGGGLPPEEKARFQEAVTSMYGKYCAEYMDMIDAIVAAAAME